MFFKKKEKKKKSCLGRIIKWGFISCVVLFLLWVWVDDDEDYISDQEAMAAKEEDDVSLDELIDLFFDWYGYVPEEDTKDYNFQNEKQYEEYSEANYQNYEHRRRHGNRDSEYWKKYWEDYYKDYGNYYKKSYKNYDDYRNKQRPNGDAERMRQWEQYYAAQGNKDYDDEYEDVKPNKPASTSPSKPSSTPAKPTTPASDRRAKFISCAKTYRGVPYKWGGTDRAGINCSGLVYMAAKDAGLGTLPRTAKTMYSIAGRVDKSERQPGDLIFFASGSDVSHVAIFLGNEQMLHAVSDGKETGVIVSSTDDKYWKKRYYASGRIIK